LSSDCKDINWAYVAGFFDGEGTIVIPERGAVRVEMSQRSQNDWVLHEIQMLFESHGIHSKIYQYEAKKGTGVWQTYLRVWRGKDGMRVLKFMLPYLIVKRERALEAISELESRMAV